MAAARQTAIRLPQAPGWAAPALRVVKPGASQASEGLHPRLRKLINSTVAARYQIDGLIAVGGMGAVFKAFDATEQRAVALKFLHPLFIGDPGVEPRFDREARAAAGLHHPNCLAVTDHGSTESGMKYLVMPFLEGQELSELLGHQLPPTRAIQLVLEILHGLAYAHSQGLVHRDVKPENVFVTHDVHGCEQLKLLDFGIAKLIGDAGCDGFKTVVGSVFGTPTYMSPEQAIGEEADVRSDLYAVGIVLYEMLAGAPPFDHDDPGCLARMQLLSPVPLLPRNVPPVLVAVVERLLAKTRKERYQTAAEVIEPLEGVLEFLLGLGCLPAVDNTRKGSTQASPGQGQPQVASDRGTRSSSGLKRIAQGLASVARLWRRLVGRQSPHRG